MQTEAYSRERAKELENIFLQTVWLDARQRTINTTDGNGNCDNLLSFEELAKITRRQITQILIRL